MNLRKKGFFASIFLGLMISIGFALVTYSSNAGENDLIAAVQQIEARLNARIGIAVIDKETDRNWRYHAGDRFPINSTYKTIACAALLSRVDSGQEQLDRIVIFDESQLADYSPVTETRVGAPGMSLGELCQATIATSDNSAANFVMQAIGGPQAVTQFMRSIGDRTSRLDRWSPELSESVPGDQRDTTSPNAMAMMLEQLVLKGTLSFESRQTLESWLKGNEISGDLIRAAVPSDWDVIDKTGSGGYGSRSIAAVMWPPQREPVIAAIYITETEVSFAERNAAIAEIGEAIVGAVMAQ
ncbi:beta-lactamase class A [Rubidibacter lacunae KORDI 51-2]|uniref:Beta-lactamase n=1 Tax=Rubidibacter lacunae KORDI 51-2 TaxID=582515 RepID=U5DDY1_9CHRO|nr:class A beta-lactamase [Rubidibacter lacunae]ERN39836.1 beta-lactamase class A [Rubidibacter lacunae KORDI 51-2]